MITRATKHLTTSRREESLDLKSEGEISSRDTINNKKTSNTFYTRTSFVHDAQIHGLTRVSKIWLCSSAITENRLSSNKKHAIKIKRCTRVYIMKVVGVHNITEEGRRGIKQYINDGWCPVRNSGSEVDLADVIPDSFVSLLVAAHDVDAASLRRSRSDKEC